MLAASWASLSLLAAQVSGAGLEFGEKTILVYESEAGDEVHQFVIRVGRFVPDRVFEWESETHQGVVHLYRDAVIGARQITLGGLFDIGSYIESKDVLTKWLSQSLFEELKSRGEAKLRLNRTRIEFSLVGETPFKLLLNKKEVEVSAICVEDNRKGRWLFLDDPRNPALLEYTSPYYRESLRRVATNGTAKLRWLKKMPPVK